MDPTKAIHNPHFVQLTGADTWRKWKSDIQVVLELNDTWPYVCGKQSPPTEKDDLDALKPKLKVAAYCLKVTCNEENRLIIGDKSDPIEIYAALTRTYEGDTPAKRMNLRRRLYHLEHDITQPMSTYLASIRTITSELASIGHSLKADEIRDVVLMNLHPSFEIIGTLLASQDKNGSSDWTIDTLGTQLTSFEESRRINNPASNPIEMAHAAYSPRRPQRSTPTSGDNWLNRQGLSGVCSRCGHPGHEAIKCFRDMPEHVKERIRQSTHHPANSANAAVTVSKIPNTYEVTDWPPMVYG